MPRTAVAGAVLVGAIIGGITTGVAEANPPLPSAVQSQINTWLEQGNVSAARYESYAKLLSELEEAHYEW